MMLIISYSNGLNLIDSSMRDRTPPTSHIARKRFDSIQKAIFSLLLFIRVSAMGGTLILPLLGAASVATPISTPQILGIFGVAITFHIFIYVLNDIIDLPVDRSEPRRSEFPLVKGTIKPWQALIFALFQIPIALAISSWMNATIHAYIALGVGLVFGVAYDVFGKRTRFPPLIDAVQGLAWGSLVVYGALATDGHVTVLTGVVFIYIVVFILLANGVHGSMRDLGNDFKCGVHSTAVYLGAKPQGTAGIYIPRRLVTYAFVLQLILGLVTLLPVVANWFWYSPIKMGLTMCVVLALSGLSFCLLRIAADSASNRDVMISAGMLQLLFSLVILIVLFTFYVDLNLLAALLLAFLLPLLTHSWLYDALRWTWRRIANASARKHSIPLSPIAHSGEDLAESTATQNTWRGD